MNSTKRAHLFISGLVQGVYFRGNIRSKAGELRLTGWVKNLPDGSVEAVFEGSGKSIKDMVEWCRQGYKSFMSRARVDRVKMLSEEFKGEFASFSIRW